MAATFKLGRWAIMFVAITACRTAGEPKPLPSAAPETRTQLPPSEYLSNEARLLLSERMERHGLDLTNLMWAMLLLDNEGAAHNADKISATGWIADPNEAGDQVLIASLP